VTKEFILFIEMSAKHLSGLINSMLDFHSNASTSLRFLDDLEETGSEKVLASRWETYIERFVVDFQRRP
jgi:hypothetical protein